ncbi:hypothetical protein [Streptosporangium sp. NPDC000396]|uniref:hypothetical protein n=1 Tax=Streptosporangium sp. NPDC000396 TaxID=3366185 RepID=UPI0036BE3FBE
MPYSTSAPPDPDDATSPAEFVMALGRLRQWSGLSYRQLAAKAEASGEVLPPSTAAGALSRAMLPREELVAAFVRACGVGEAGVAHWVSVRRHLAVSAAPRPLLPVEEAHDALSPAESRRDDIPHAPGLDPSEDDSSYRDPSGESYRDPSGESPARPHPSGEDSPHRTSSDRSPSDLDPADQDPPGLDPTGPGSADTDPTRPGSADVELTDPGSAGGKSARPGPADPAVRPWWRRPMPVVLGIAAVLAVTGFAVVFLTGVLTASPPRSSTANPPSSQTPAPIAPGQVLANGWYRIMPSHIARRDLCVGEGHERNQRTARELAVQRPCRGLSPDTYVRAVGHGVYQIEWHSPVQGVGCLTVDQAYRGNGALIGPANCTGAAHQSFGLERTGSRSPAGFVVHPVHSGRCVGLLGGEADVDAGAELAQHTCTGRADQVFLFVPRPDPTVPR